MKGTVEGIELDLSHLQMGPGLVNAHDHLEFALFPRLGQGPYPNAEAWARDIYHPDESPLREHLSVPKHLRLLWGGLRNLLAGVTLVQHHNPWHPVFEDHFPVHVLRKYRWAHSLAFADDFQAEAANGDREAPLFLHLGESTDGSAKQELSALGAALNARAVLVHAVGLDDGDWAAVEAGAAGVVWCPRSNLFTLGQTLSPARLWSDVPIGLGTDSPLTATGDLLDELRAARAYLNEAGLRRMLQVTNRTLLGGAEDRDDWIATPAFGEPPELVVRKDRILLIGAALAAQCPPRFLGSFTRIRVGERPEVLVRWPVADWLRETREHLGPVIRLGGREVEA